MEVHCGEGPLVGRFLGTPCSKCQKLSQDGRSVLNFDQLNTLLIEIECVLNSRPLTYVEDDTRGISYALTPSHLIYGRSVLTLKLLVLITY